MMSALYPVLCICIKSSSIGNLCSQAVIITLQSCGTVHPLNAAQYNASNAAQYKAVCAMTT